MVKLLGLLLKNLGRNKLRTTLTALAVVVLVAIYTFASTVTDKINQMVAAHSSHTRLIVREKWVMPSRFPIRYMAKIDQAAGVDDWTVWHFYGGYLDDAGHAGAGIATRMDNLRDMHPGMEELDADLLAAMDENKQGVLMGRGLMDQMKWDVGQKFTCLSFTHLGKDLEFQIVGELPSDLWSNNFFFRQDYYQEATGDRESVNVAWVRVANSEVGKRVAAEIEKLFANSHDKLRVETESAGVGRFMGRTSTIVSIINFVVTILLVDMIVVLSNSISMTVRERRKEMAILKILGFSPAFILTMIIGEAMTVGMFGGLLGSSLAYGASVLNAARQLPWQIDFLLQFPIPVKFIVHGLVVGAGVGFLGSAVPAWSAQKVQVVEAFSHAG